MTFGHDPKLNGLQLHALSAFFLPSDGGSNGGVFVQRIRHWTADSFTSASGPQSQCCPVGCLGGIVADKANLAITRSWNRC